MPQLMSNDPADFVTPDPAASNVGSNIDGAGDSGPRLIALPVEVALRLDEALSVVTVLDLPDELDQDMRLLALLRECEGAVVDRVAPGLEAHLDSLFPIIFLTHQGGLVDANGDGGQEKAAEQGGRFGPVLFL